MIHLGERAFYDAVYKDACAHDAVLVEGVRSPVTTRITRSYRWIEKSKKIGLTLQPRHPQQSDCSARIIHADLSGPEFESLWRSVPLSTRLLLYVTAPIYGLLFRWFGTREALAKGHTLDDLTSREERLRWTAEGSAVGNVILTARDKHLVSVMDQYLDDPSAEPRRLAIVFGAGHMRAVIQALTKLRGFHLVDGDWMTIFELE